MDVVVLVPSSCDAVRTAIGFLVAARRLEPRAAERSIQAAARAGVAVSVLAGALVGAFDPQA